MCGGTLEKEYPAHPELGLSPRVRGNLPSISTVSRMVRSIPACAGEPTDLTRLLGWGMVYPRVCGGTYQLVWASPPCQGLSPRVRGNRYLGAPNGVIDRSIPACAGEPDSGGVGVKVVQVYPRVCGGTHLDGEGDDAPLGLSPRVRGNQGAALPKDSAARSIPACAGEPGYDYLPMDSDRVYPRVCGGTSLGCPECLRRRGLSPRVRGNLSQKEAAAMLGGSIPACAGEPNLQSVREGALTVYPRVCGGTILRLCRREKQKGLSPRVRGNHDYNPDAQSPAGSIPACAGEPRPPPGIAPGGGVYPRVCGGTYPDRDGGEGTKGLSPRVRGNRFAAGVGKRREGSIPACAGEPAGWNCEIRYGRVYPRVCGGTLER